MKIGIFFGGQSREREISFAGGRTVYDNLNKALFEPVPIFVDSMGNFIKLNWQYIYKGTIRDFYPPVKFTPASKHGYQIYAESLGELTEKQLVEIANEVGELVHPHQFKSMFDFAFLALHGAYGEDGNIQGLLEWYNIPYSGSGILPSAIGIDKSLQREMLRDFGFPSPKSQTISRADWAKANPKELFESLKAHIGLPIVVKAAHQGSSIGVNIVAENDLAQFTKAVEKALFIEEITAQMWKGLSETAQRKFIFDLVDIRSGIGLPVIWETAQSEESQTGSGSQVLKPAIADSQIPVPQNHTETIYHPDVLLSRLGAHFAQSEEKITLTALDSEDLVLFEEFIAGKEFSTIVIQDEAGQPLALPPTQILKGKAAMFDYRSKYLPGMVRKVTPIDLPSAQIRAIQEASCEMYQKCHFNVYARIDGFITDAGEIFLNDPNTTSGMMPSSFFFHQAAEIGLNPSQFLTYIIRTSLAERVKSGKKSQELAQLLAGLDISLSDLGNAQQEKIKVAVLLGGYSSERHISVESGRNIYEKLASSDKYEPIPVFLTKKDASQARTLAEEEAFQAKTLETGDGRTLETDKNKELVRASSLEPKAGTQASSLANGIVPASEHALFIIPTNILLKDNADDIREKAMHSLQGEQHEIIAEVIANAQSVTKKYAQNAIFKAQEISYEQLPQLVDAVFIALHGRPGEDGAVQAKMEELGLPYNGSSVESSQITIDKYATNELLAKNGMIVAQHQLVHKADWEADADKVLADLAKNFGFPLIAKPSDDGCSSAVKKVDSAEEFQAFASLMFRQQELLMEAEAKILGLKINEEFPQKPWILVEELISPNGADHFLEVTGGLLTKFEADGTVSYEVFEPSEALATAGILSLEEKFLAGEGQNITPARFDSNPEKRQKIADQVRADLEKTAKILQIEGYTRIDAFVRIYGDRAETIVIEANSLPGMTPATCIFHQTAINGYTPLDFVDRILEFGKLRVERK